MNTIKLCIVPWIRFVQTLFLPVSSRTNVRDLFHAETLDFSHSVEMTHISIFYAKINLIHSIIEVLRSDWGEGSS